MTDSKPRRKRREEHEEHENHERWLVTYADMVTLLMVLFIVMFAMSVVDEKKFNALKEGLAAGFGDSTADPRRLRQHPRQAGVSDVDLIEANEYVRKMQPEEQAKFKQALAREEQLKKQRAYAEADAEVNRLEELLRRAGRGAAREGPARRRAGRDRRARPGDQPGLQARGVRARPGRAQRPRHRGARHDGAGAARGRRTAADRRAHQPGPGDAEVLPDRLGALRCPGDHRPAPPQRGRRHRRTSG